METNTSRNYLLTIPMQPKDAYDAVLWAADQCAAITSREPELGIVRFRMACGQYGEVTFSGKINPAEDGESSLLKIAATGEMPGVTVHAYEIFAKMLAETYDGLYGEEDPEHQGSYFDGGLLELIGWHVLGWIVTVFTLGICYPWACCMIYKWETEHTVINGHRLYFTGNGAQLFGNWLKWLILTIITLGIYGLWVGIKLRQWRAEHTEVWD